MASMKFATAALVLMATCATLATSAWASSNYPLSKVPVSGTTVVNGVLVPVTGFVEILNFAKGSLDGLYPGQLVAIGKLTLVDLSNLQVTNFLNNNNVEIPISNLVVLDNEGNILSQNSILSTILGRKMLSSLTCKVLNLELGPLNLDILGLNISLNKVLLVITADALGGLLGSLLCSLVGATTLNGVILLLNSLLTILNVPLLGLKASVSAAVGLKSLRYRPSN